MSSLINKYDGMRKMTISSKQADGTRKVAILLGNKVGADGLDLDVNPIEQTIESYQSTHSVPVGVELKPATAHLIPYDIEDKGAILPVGYDAKTNTWNAVMEGCNLSDVTVAFEKVCKNSDGTNGVNYIFRHAQLSVASKMSVKRATTTQLDLAIYLTPVPGSEYGLDGDLSSLMMAWQEYYGIYDGTKDAVTYDPVSQPNQSSK